MPISQLDGQGMDRLLTAAAAAVDLNERSRLISEAAAHHLQIAGDPPESELSVPPLEAVIDDFPET
jgi:hypothetical protein